MKLLLTLLIMLNGIIIAQDYKMFGEGVPGKIIIVHADGIEYALLNNDTLNIEKDCDNFVIGFDRDDTGLYLLKFKLKSGKVVFKQFDLPERKYKIQRINHMKTKYVKPPKEQLNRIAEERKIKAEKRKTIGLNNSAIYKSGFQRPIVGGRVTSVFGSQRILNGVPKNPHNGYDIAAPRGTSVYAMADGIVTLTADNFYYSGNFVLLDHGQGLNSSYLHLSKIVVKEGAKVLKGQKIGEIGTTGRSTGPHLHWSVQWFNKRIDPNSLLESGF